MYRQNLSVADMLGSYLVLGLTLTTCLLVAGSVAARVLPTIRLLPGL